MLYHSCSWNIVLIIKTLLMSSVLIHVHKQCNFNNRHGCCSPVSTSCHGNRRALLFYSMLHTSRAPSCTSSQILCISFWPKSFCTIVFLCVFSCRAQRRHIQDGRFPSHNFIFVWRENSWVGIQCFVQHLQNNDLPSFVDLFQLFCKLN